MLERLRQAGWSIQAHFLLYSSALLIPALIFSALMIVRSASLERSAMESDINEVVRSVAIAIDRELAATTTTLTALASSPALTDGDFKAFYNQAAAARDVSGIDFFLTTRGGKLLLSTKTAWGEPPGPAPPIIPKDILNASGAVVSDVYSAEGAGEAPTFSISVPVKRGNKPIYVLSALISSRRIFEIFQRAQLDPGWVATVIDRKGMVVARSKDFGEHAGRPWLSSRSAGPVVTGLSRATDSDGESVLRASTHSQQSGWLVSTTVPEAIANRPIVHSWALVVTLALSFVILSALLAYLFGRRFSDPVRVLVEKARDLGRGEVVAPIASSIIEVRAVGEALAAASKTRQRMERSLRVSEDRLRLALASAETGAWDWNLKTGVLTWDQRMRELWGLGAEDNVTYEVFISALNPLDRAVTIEAIGRAQDPDDPSEYDVEYRVRGVHDGVERWISAQGRAHFADGQAVRMTGTARDITDRKRWEDHIQLLMREVTHRSKNLLAVIQAMARQTKLASCDVHDFEVRFSGRLQALAASHDLLVQRDWHGASMSAVVESQLGHYLDQKASQIEIDGPNLIVTPEAAQNIGLAVHELSTNAAKYGALSVPDGRVKVRWQRARDGGESGRLRLSWIESGGPEVIKPSRRGFGYVVTEQLTARALQGKANLSFERKGVSWSLDIPDCHIMAPDHTAEPAA